MNIPLGDFLLFLPEIFVLTMACAILVVEVFFGTSHAASSATCLPS